MKSQYQQYRSRMEEIFKQYAESKALTYLLENDSQCHYTFSQVFEIINWWAKALSGYEISAGDRMAIIAPLTPNTVIAGLTLAYANITAVLLDATLPAEEINRLLEFSDVQGIFTTEDFFPKIVEKRVPIFDLDRSGLQLVLFDSCACRNSKALCVERDPDVIAIIYSSGTTSSMKGVMHTYESVLCSWEKLAFSYGLKPGVRYFMVLPFNHISGYISATAFLLSGDTICLIENLTPARLQKGLLEFSPHYFGMVPKVYDIMADKIRGAIREKGRAAEMLLDLGFRLSGFLRKNFGLKIGKILFKFIYSRALGKDITGLAILGTICNPETAKLFLAFGLEWANLYATTETNAPVTTTGIFDRYPLNSVGKVDRFDSIDVQIHAPNERGIGEIYVKTPLIMKGYFREPQLTVGAFENGYFKTGDLGYTDKSGYLYLVGRSKDTIILHNGKKVSATDIDEFYQRECLDVKVASCGIPEADGFDTVHLFIETHGQGKETIDQAHRLIMSKSSSAGSIYKISSIHEIDQIPLTSIGKVKRFILKEHAEKAGLTQPVMETLPEIGESFFDTIHRLVMSLADDPDSVAPNSRLKEDLGMDSLNMFELCVALEEKFNISVEPYLHDGITVGEIVALIEQGVTEPEQKKLSSDQYPLVKTERDIKSFQRFMAWSRRLWKIETFGLENICPDEKYIFCPNHESHLDGMWIIGNLDDRARREMCSLAASYLFEHKIFRPGLTVLGGIPVHRSGNTAPAIKRAYECLISGNYHLLIHPEGTRTRSGKLGGFKPGAAKLSMDTGVKIIPVCINGAYEIFPPHRKLPRLFDWKHLRRYRLQICFGTPINPSGKTAEEITGEIKHQIVSMRHKEI